jgi:hypothetical protein
MYAERNLIAYSRNHRCSGKSAMRSVCIVEINVTVNNVKVQNVAENCFYGEYFLPTTVKCA